jgi:hypothetical protein
MTIPSFLLLFAPLIYHLVNDKDGELPDEKSTDIMIVIAIACVAAISLGNTFFRLRLFDQHHFV